MEVNSSDEENTPVKKRKLHYDQKYSTLWEQDVKYKGWAQKSKKGEYYFYCNSCKCDLKCGGGKIFLDRHAESNKHKSNIKGMVHQPAITSLLPASTSKLFTDKVKLGEIKIASWLTKHDLPFNIAGDLTYLIRSVCTDSKFALELSMERTKAQAIVTQVTGKAAENELVGVLQNNKFSLIVDESTDRSTTKHLALMVRTSVGFNVADSFLGLIPVVDGTATSLYNECKEFFAKRNIPYQENMVGFAADGTNSMFGQHHSLSTFLAKDIPNLFLMKCICHSFHLCASYACRKLPRGEEDFARDVYNYIQSSPKRTGDYKTFQSFVNVKPHKLSHPAQTRWLSLLEVVRRLLEQLPALKLYFTNAVLNDRLLSAQSILDKCCTPTTELYLEFLMFVLPYFNDLNKEMQSERPKIYLLYENIFTTFKAILECCLKPELLELTAEEQRCTDEEISALETKILNIDFENKENHLPLEDIYLRGNIKQLITMRANSISSVNIHLFREKCLDFYIESVKKIKTRFPFEDLQRERLKSLKFLNPETLIDPNLKRAFPSLSHLGQLFPGEKEMADTFQAKLVEAVEKYPCLYNFYTKEYSNREKVSRAWEAVAQEVESSVKECKDTWRNLRIVFARNIKNPPSGSKAKKKPWPLLQSMMFLKSYVTAKGNDLPGNLPSPPSQSLEAVDDPDPVSESQGVEETDGESGETGTGIEPINPPYQGTESMRPPPKKKKKMQTNTADEIVMDYIQTKSNASRDTPRKNFLLSLLPEVEEMTTSQFKIFRREIVSLIDRIGAPTCPTASATQFSYQQQASRSPSSTQSWSCESSGTTFALNSHYSENFNIPQRDQLYTELEP